ncbi:MAG: LysR family transcriptional regulator [Rhodobacteraceae bacterium]|nr:LysR family transcriptional regulator [Paracoccaceae bacterium]
MQLPDLDLLQTFLTVAEHQSISQAAQTLELTQPAVTKKIKRLEESLQVPVIDRNARPLQLTEAGMILRDRAPGLLSDARKLASDIRSMSKSGLPLLRIGMSDTLSEILGAEFVGGMQSYAHVVELKSSISPWLETAFRARHFDLAVDSPPFVDTQQIDTKLLFRDPFVVVVPTPLAEKPLEEILRTENYVGYGRSTKFGTSCTQLLAQLGVDRPTRFNFDSTQSLLRFVQAGYGWAITTAFCLLQSPTALKDVSAMRCPNSEPREFYLLNRKGEHEELAAAAAQRFSTVFNQLVDGPWVQIAPRTARMIAEANVDLRPAQSVEPLDE